MSESEVCDRSRPSGEYAQGLEDVLTSLTAQERARFVYVMADRASTACLHYGEACCQNHYGAMEAIRAIFPEIVD